MKAILVVDIPDDYNIEEIRVNIQANSYGEEILDWRNQTLIPMPTINNLKIGVTSHDRFADGWNHCVKYILGESDPAKAYPDETYSPQPVTTKFADLTECKEGKQVTKIIKDTMKELWEKQNDR